MYYEYRLSFQKLQRLCNAKQCKLDTRAKLGTAESTLKIHVECWPNRKVEFNYFQPLDYPVACDEKLYYDLLLCIETKEMNKMIFVVVIHNREAQCTRDTRCNGNTKT